VALNFGDLDQVVSFRLPLAGDYTEGLHGLDNLHGVHRDEERMLTVPSNYGRIWTVVASA
jgi:maltooligosyltrehalose trehalohydrolase